MYLQYYYACIIQICSSERCTRSLRLRKHAKGLDPRYNSWNPSKRKQSSTIDQLMETCVVCVSAWVCISWKAIYIERESLSSAHVQDTIGSNMPNEHVMGKISSSFIARRIFVLPIGSSISKTSLSISLPSETLSLLGILYVAIWWIHDHFSIIWIFTYALI